MSTHENNRNFYTVVLYCFAFLLLWEWLRPLGQLANMDHIEVFLGFLLLSFIGSYLRANRVMLVAIKAMYILISIYLFYYEGGFLSASWVFLFFKEIARNIGNIAHGSWYDLSNDFNTLLFFILQWLLVYLLSFWLLNRQRIFLFFLMTVIYLAVLDTFTPYDANSAIVRTVVIGLMATGMLTLNRIIKKERVASEPFFLRKWLIPLISMVAISAAVGIIAPKAAPLWPDPVPFIKSLSEKTNNDGSGGIAKIGYGTDDSHLGGPFISDKKPVFHVLASNRHYWQVETKDLYTGKGWDVSGIDSAKIPLGVNSEMDGVEKWDVPFNAYPQSVHTTKEVAKISMEMKYPHLVYPLGLKRIDSTQLLNFSYDERTEKIFSFDDVPVYLNYYVLEFESPTFQVAELMKVTDADKAKMDSAMLKRYTELPPNLPARVKKLAKTITASKTNWYDQAKAIENYFDLPDFTYDQKNVAVPDQKTDYVDQFLFETKKGYCDNFSTSMAVLLRTLGIPTRWIKGYSNGQFEEYSQSDPKLQSYVITNNNAHSWVEVYFPGTGWVPFEPTKGFTSTVQFSYDIPASAPGGSKLPLPIPVKKPVKNPEALGEKNVQPESGANNQSLAERTRQFFKQNGWNVFWAIVLTVVVSGFLYKIRSKWYPYFLIFRFSMRNGDEQFAKAYLVLLKQFERYGITRKNGQTLRSYASYIDFFFSTTEMGKFTAHYEQFMYKGNLPAGSWNQMRELWENLIKKTIT